jgi:hypothetical protein
MDRAFYARRKSYAKMTPAERLVRDQEDRALNAEIRAQVARIQPVSPCTHESLQGPPKATCRDCGATFASFEDAYQSRRAAKNQ